MREAQMRLAANLSKTILSLFRGCYRPSFLAYHGAFCVNTRQLWGQALYRHIRPASLQLTSPLSTFYTVDWKSCIR